jgi:hypothetical protein
VSGAATRIGGLCGIAAALVIIPAYTVGSPETPKTSADAQSYYDSASSFLTANGTLPLLHLLFGLLFLGALVALLRSASGPSMDVYVALAGGAVFLALTAAGLAAEVAVPAAIVQFDDVSITQYTQPFLALSFWLYQFSQIGSAALIFATALAVWRTGVLPKWTAVLAILGVLPLLHTWIGLAAAYSTVVWLGLTGLVMLALPPKVQVESVGA